MTIRPMFIPALLLAAMACGGGDDQTDTDGQSGDQNGGDSQGDGHDNAGDDTANSDDGGDANDGADGDDGNGGQITYPNFVPGNCFGSGCPHGACGDPTSPPCWELYEDTFDADYGDYCRAGGDASYCVGSSAYGPGEPPGETYCINCMNGSPSFQHCRDAGAHAVNGRLQCLNPY